jgi:hypothetical protein
MDMQTLNRMKSEAIDALVALVKPHMSISQRLKDTKGEPLMFWQPDGAEPMTIKLEKSSMPPIYAICKEGVLCNGYGNAWIRKWDEVGVEDVVKLTAVAQEALAPVAVPQALAQSEAFSVESLEPLDRARTMFNVRGKQRDAAGQERAFSFSVAFANAGHQYVKEIADRFRRWTPGAVSKFTEDLEDNGAEVLLAQV